MKFVILCVLLFQFSHCALLTLTWIGKELDESHPIQVKKSCENSKIIYDNLLLGKATGLTFGTIADSNFTKYLLIKVGQFPAFLYAVPTTVFFIIGVTHISIHETSTFVKTFKGWDRDYKSDCNSPTDFYYKEYTTKSNLIKAQIDDEKTQDFHFLKRYCKESTEPIAKLNFQRDMLVDTISREITNSELKIFQREFNPNGSLPLLNVSCDYSFSRGNDSKKSDSLLCECTFAMQIKGGKNKLLAELEKYN